MKIIAKNKIRSKVKKMNKPLPLKDGVELNNVIDDINKSFPINFKKYNFIKSIHSKYPLAPKEDIALIVKTVFEVIRENMIDGYSFNIKNIFNEFRLVITSSNNFNFLKIKNKTFPTVRRRDYEP
jgi:hypothetical protein